MKNNNVNYNLILDLCFQLASKEIEDDDSACAWETALFRKTLNSINGKDKNLFFKKVSNLLLNPYEYYKRYTTNQELVDVFKRLLTEKDHNTFMNILNEELRKREYLSIRRRTGLIYKYITINVTVDCLKEVLETQLILEAANNDPVRSGDKYFSTNKYREVKHLYNNSLKRFYDYYDDLTPTQCEAFLNKCAIISQEFLLTAKRLVDCREVYLGELYSKEYFEQLNASQQISRADM